MPARTELPAQLRDLIDGGAAAVTAREITEAGLSPAAGVVPLRRPGRRVPRPGRVAALAAGIVVVGCAGAVAVSQLAGPAPRPAASRAGDRPAVHAVHHQQVALTARMMHKIALASRAALASAGHALVSYHNEDGGLSIVSGTDDLTFSGNNFNNVNLQAGSKIGPWTDRVVNGQIYDYGELAPGDAPHWYHSVSETQNVREAVPDPRDLLKALAPGARFVSAGWQVLDGTRVQKLRATRLSGLPGKLLSLENADPSQKLTALTVWADASGVIRQVRTAFQGLLDGAVDYTTVKVDFVDIGKPETIIAPASYINQVTHG
jgi:hypothetical protein